MRDVGWRIQCMDMETTSGQAPAATNPLAGADNVSFSGLAALVESGAAPPRCSRRTRRRTGLWTGVHGLDRDDGDVDRDDRLEREVADSSGDRAPSTRPGRQYELCDAVGTGTRRHASPSLCRTSTEHLLDAARGAVLRPEELRRAAAAAAVVAAAVAVAAVVAVAVVAVVAVAVSATRMMAATAPFGGFNAAAAAYRCGSARRGDARAAPAAGYRLAIPSAHRAGATATLSAPPAASQFRQRRQQRRHVTPYSLRRQYVTAADSTARRANGPKFGFTGYADFEYSPTGQTEMARMRSYPGMSDSSSSRCSPPCTSTTSSCITSRRKLAGERSQQ